jgi:hypothetical protein
MEAVKLVSPDEEAHYRDVNFHHPLKYKIYFACAMLAIIGVLMVRDF